MDTVFRTAGYVKFLLVIKRPWACLLSQRIRHPEYTGSGPGVEVPYCKIEDSEQPKYLLSDGDIVFARTGATTGKSYLVRKPPKSIFASYLICLKGSGKIV